MNKKVNTFSIEDRTNIKEVVFKYPELMSSEATNIIKNEANTILETREELYKCREKVRELEVKLQYLIKSFENKKDILEVVYDTKKVQHTITQTNVSFTGLGNDTLGIHSA